MPKRSYGWTGPGPPDIRDFHFSPSRSTLATLPARADLSAPSLPAPFEPALNQLDLGSCGPNSLAEHLVFDLLKQGITSVPLPSRLFIYYLTREIMGTISSDSGVDNRSMMKAVAKGWCDESLWPYDIGRYTEKPPDACYGQANKRAGAVYSVVRQDLQTMKGCLAAGLPFILGFTVYESFESDSVSHTGIVPMPKRRERVLGGHDVVAVGYNDDNGGYFKFKNSWGAWGDGGYGYMPYAYATSSSLSGDYWTVEKVPWDVPVPVPPGPTPHLAALLSVDAASNIWSVTPVVSPAPDRDNLAQLRAAGCPEHTATRLAAFSINWLSLLTLVAKYGPVVWTIAADLLAGKPVADVFTQYGAVALEIVGALVKVLAEGNG